LVTSETNTFHTNIQELKSLLEKTKSDIEVVEIINSWLELLISYNEKVKSLDLKELAPFLNRRSEKMLHLLKQCNLEKKVLNYTIDSSYIFYYHSITIIIGTKTLLYPYMLVIASNYNNFIPKLSNDLKRKIGGKITLVGFLTVFYALYSAGIPRLVKKDWQLLKRISKIQTTNRDDYIEKMRRVGYGHSRRFRRLRLLKVSQNSFVINFPAIGYIPYILISFQEHKLSQNMKKFVEIEYSDKKHGNTTTLRIMLIPSVYEEEWVEILSSIGEIDKIQEIYSTINWNTLYQTRKGSWKWRINLTENNLDLSDELAINNLFVNMKRINGLTTQYIKFIDIVRRLGTVHSEELSTITGLSTVTVKKYLKSAQNREIIIPEWHINRIGLNYYFQVVLRANKIDHQFIDILEKLPKLKVIKSKKLIRYLFFLPTKTSVNQISAFIKKFNTSGECEILYQGKILDSVSTIIKGVDIFTTWDSLKN